MRNRVSLFIYQDGRILFFYRIKADKNYHVAIGGGVETGESITEAAHREAKEETNFEIVLGPRLWVREVAGEHREHAYLVTEFSGRLALGGPELARQTPANRHVFQWVPLDDLPDLALYPAQIGSEQMTALQKALSA